MQNILILQHQSHEGPGAWEPLFQQKGRRVVTRRLYQGEKVPQEEELCEWDGIVILGGPMNVHEGDRYEFIRDELKIIPQILSLKLPLLGICLGSQLIAKALGAKVYPGPTQEIGWYPLQLTDSAGKDPFFTGLPFQGMIFQWHAQTFDLPSGAVRLAGSRLYQNQAFRYTDRIYGLQFHCEMTEPMILDWVEKGREEIIQAGLSPEKILEDTPKYLSTLRHWAHQIGEKWLELK